MQIDFIGFAPDLDPSTPGILVDCDRTIPTSRGFLRPMPGLVAQGSALAATPFGAFAAYFINGTVRYFAGTLTHLYELTGGAWTEVDGGTIFAPTSTTPGGVWRFCTFGNHCIAVDGKDATQFCTNSGNFSALAGSPPIGSVICSASNNFVVIGNTVTSAYGTGFQDQLAWCAQGDDGTWAPSTSVLSGNTRLLDTPGGITAMKGMGANLVFVVYKQQATYLVQFVGLPTIWQIIRYSSLIGAWSQESVVDTGQMHVFPSTDDFWTFDGIRLQRLKNPLKQWFFNNCNIAAVAAGTSNIFGAYDRMRDIVYWFFPTTTTAIDTWVAWNTKSNIWTKGTLTVTSILDKEFNPGGIPSVGVFQSSTLNTISSGTTDPASYVTTGDNGDGVGMYFLSRLRPKFVTFPSANVTITGYTRVNLGTTPPDTRTNPVSLLNLTSGWMNMRQAGRWHSFKLAFAGDCEIEGLELEAQPEGDR